VFDLDGTPAAIEDVISLIKSQRSDAMISYIGDAMPFPADADNGKLNQFLGISGCRSITQGINDTMAVFDQARERGIDLNQLLNKTIRRNS
jgi:hypothetical protein